MAAVVSSAENDAVHSDAAGYPFPPVSLFLLHHHRPLFHERLTPLWSNNNVADAAPRLATFAVVLPDAVSDTFKCHTFARRIAVSLCHAARRPMSPVLAFRGDSRHQTALRDQRIAPPVPSVIRENPAQHAAILASFFV
jgi:hypothetical protein